MKLTVKNFGPIREARNINISPMTIFVGPSNTGKSYLAMLIYSIFKVIADEDYAWEITSRIRGGRKNYLDISNNLNKSKSSALAVIEASFYEWAKATSDAWKHQLIYCFGEEGRNLVEAKNGNDGFSVIVSDNDDQLTLNLTSPANSNTTLRKRKQLHEYIKLRFSDNIEEHMVQETSWESDESELSRSVIHRQYPEIILQQFQSSLLPWKPLETFIDAHYLPDSKLTKLDKEKCSVYLFKPGRGGNKTTVKKIPFNSETGLLTQDHLDVSSALYNETVELMEQRDNAGSQTDIQ